MLNHYRVHPKSGTHVVRKHLHVATRTLPITREALLQSLITPPRHTTAGNIIRHQAAELALAELASDDAPFTAWSFDPREAHGMLINTDPEIDQEDPEGGLRPLKAIRVRGWVDVEVTAHADGEDIYVYWDTKVEASPPINIRDAVAPMGTKFQVHARLVVSRSPELPDNWLDECDDERDDESDDD